MVRGKQVKAVEAAVSAAFPFLCHSAFDAWLSPFSSRLSAWRLAMTDGILLRIDRLPAPITPDENVGENCSLHLATLFISR
jgi:hypothetical protein